MPVHHRPKRPCLSTQARGFILFLIIQLPFTMATIKFVDDDLTVNATVGQNLRDVAQNEGSTIPFGCEQGICGTCLSHIKSPEGTLSSMEEQEKETLEALGAEVDCRLVCQCRVEKDGDVEITSAH